jgi:hypothetical protein
MIKVMFAIISIGTMCTACQSNDANLRRESARIIGNYTPDQIAVSEVDRGMTTINWKAATPNGTYKCTADDMLRRVKCVN